mmetsp:Transcript_55594/g.92458  ORF Transcript_55594/g.92458 Transcript_55594/m.92458 type:complete len:313 (-) Transcript_55594:2144-3082(-)
MLLQLFNELTTTTTTIFTCFLAFLFLSRRLIVWIHLVLHLFAQHNVDTLFARSIAQLFNTAQQFRYMHRRHIEFLQHALSNILQEHIAKNLRTIKHSHVGRKLQSFEPLTHFRWRPIQHILGQPKLHILLHLLQYLLLDLVGGTRNRNRFLVVNLGLFFRLTLLLLALLRIIIIAIRRTFRPTHFFLQRLDLFLQLFIAGIRLAQRVVGILHTLLVCRTHLFHVRRQLLLLLLQRITLRLQLLNFSAKISALFVVFVFALELLHNRLALSLQLLNLCLQRVHLFLARSFHIRFNGNARLVHVFIKAFINHTS